MTVLTLKLSSEAYRRLQEQAAHLGKSPQAVAQEWLAERAERLTAVHESLARSSAIYMVDAPPAEPEDDRERAYQALRAAGLLTDLDPNLRRLADPMVHLESVRAALGRAGGKSLSEIVLEQRGLEK